MIGKILTHLHELATVAAAVLLPEFRAPTQSELFALQRRTWGSNRPSWTKDAAAFVLGTTTLQRLKSEAETEALGSLSTQASDDNQAGTERSEAG